LIDSDNVPNNANPNYDANGNTLVDNGSPTQDRYDAENRLIGRGTNITLAYDDEGNRVSKTVNGLTIYYLVDDQNPSGYAQVLAEYTGSVSNAPTVTYEYGLALIEETYDGTPFYYAYDGQGNVRFLLDTNGGAADSYDYDAWGNLLYKGAMPDVNNYLFTGQQWDPDLGMYYLRARYYNPNLGRFWTMDTYEGDQTDPLSLHKYLYCGNNPVNQRDPSGHGDMSLTSVLVVASVAAIVMTYVGCKIYHNSAITKLRVGNALQNSSRNATQVELDKINDGFHQIGSTAMNPARDAIADGTMTVMVVTNAAVTAGAHIFIQNGVMYLPESQFNDPRDPAWIAFFAFGEYQHDVLNGKLSESEAQEQLDAIIQTLPAPYNTWHWQHGGER
jgi:RHS repeat-associated protein